MKEIGERAGVSTDTVARRLHSVGISKEETSSNENWKKRFRTTRKCANCGERFEYWRPSSERKYCSIECSNEGQRVYSDEDLLRHLRELTVKHGKLPSALEIVAAKRPAQKLYQRRFGGVPAARKLAGCAEVLARTRAAE